MHTRGARVIRAFVAASMATFVAAVSHTLGGGAAPTLTGVAASLVLSLAVCTALTGRALSLWRLTASVAASQVMFHAFFVGLGTPVALAHAHSGSDPAGVLDTAPAHATMWGAHAVACLATVVALRYGEAAFWRFAGTARILTARLTRFAVAVVLTPAPTAPISVQRQTPTVLTLVLCSMSHRGPPRELAAA
jgi:hypothetical protein